MPLRQSLAIAACLVVAFANAVTYPDFLRDRSAGAGGTQMSPQGVTAERRESGAERQRGETPMEVLRSDGVDTSPDLRNGALSIKHWAS